MSEGPQLSSTPTTVYSINDDVLLYIFIFNADMFSYSRALDTTRITAQVCSQWRELMLETASLWAHLIDMDHISKRRTHEWRNELVRRSGAALLWIKAGSLGREIPKSPHEKCIVQFFFNLVHGNLHRIQKLIVSSYSAFMLTRSMLCVPAPHLEHCEAPSISEADVQTKDAITGPLFSNHAPMLCSIHLSGNLVDQEASWLCHIRSMVLDDTYSVPHAIAILSATHSLQALEIKDISNRDMTTSLPIASLPHLKCLEYSSYSGVSGAAVALLGRLEIPVDCSLIIHINDFDSTPWSTEKKICLSAINIFTRHAERHLRSDIFRYIALGYLQNDEISFTCRTSLSAESQLSICIPLCGDSDAHLLEMFLKKLTWLDLTNTTILDFTADGRLNPCFGPFFSRLPSVERISVNFKTLSLIAHLQKRYVNNSSKKPSIFFPVLKVIDHHIFHCFSFVNQVAAAFLLSRLQEGHPVTILDLSDCPPLDGSPDLDDLAEVKGLKVLYRLSDRVVEYICGSDIPEKDIDTDTMYSTYLQVS